MVELGERVMYLRPNSRGHHKLDCRWEICVWLGVKDNGPEVIIGTAEGCIKVRDVRRFGVDADKWKKEAVEAVKGTPWEPVPGQSSLELKSKVTIIPEGEKIEKSEVRPLMEYPGRGFPSGSQTLQL